VNKVEAAKLRLLALAPYVKPSQNRKDINGLVNGDIHQHDRPEYTERDREMVAIAASQKPRQGATIEEI